MSLALTRSMQRSHAARALVAPLSRACGVAPAALASRAWRAARVAAPTSMLLQQARRSLHVTARWHMGGGGDPDAHPFTHGTDFLPRAAVERRVKMVLAEVEKIDKQKLEDPNATFRELGLDSLDEVEVVMMLEEEFVIDIQDEVASTILSPLDAINYITQHPFAHHDHDDHDDHGHH